MIQRLPWLLCLLLPTAWAETLTLQQALQQAAQHHPNTTQAQARLREAQARGRQLLAEYGLSLRLRAEARWIDVPEGSFYTSADDSRAQLLLEKTLYDFGRKNRLQQSGQALTAAAEAGAEDLRQQMEQETAAAFFDILLADLAFNTANEAMSIAYIRYDRARERLELEQVSELEVAERYAAYQDTRLAVRQAEHAQRLTRERLALLLGPEAEPPSEVEIPALVLDHPLPEFETLLPRQAHYAPLRALRQQARALQAEAEAARRQTRPSLRLEAAYTEYRQPFVTRSPGSASLILDWPLSDGGQARSRAAVLEAQAEQIDSQTRRLALEWRSRLLETLQRIQRLQVEMERNRARRDFQELNLDKKRALYEMEVKADLGNAMVQQSQVQLDSARTRYRLALAWLELAQLTGQNRWKPWKEHKPHANE